MTNAHFILSKKTTINQVKILEKLGLKVSYSYKTNHEVGNILQDKCPEIEFSLHALEEVAMIKNKSKISFFTQAESKEELESLIKNGVKNFVIDNEIDLKKILEIIEKTKTNIDLSLRMKFQEHRIGTGKYFVYGMPSYKINEIIKEIKNNPLIKKLGIHLHRKSQNTSEWEISEEIEDSLTKETLERINFINLGGGLPVKYRSYTAEIQNYIFKKLTETINFLKKKNIETIIEPGRFIAAPSIKLITEIIQIYDNNIILNTTIYNCALDTIIGEHKMLIEEEQKIGENYLIKGNSPTRDDIFRYNVQLKNPKIGDKITFLNAGAYNYTTDFFGYKKLKTIILN